MPETIIYAILSFIGTNIDDMFINTLFFAETETGAERCGVILGKYLGIGALVLLSICGAFGLKFFPQKYMGILGLVPIGLGIREWIHGRRSENENDVPERKAAGGVLNVTIVTMANGADNIGVYLPLFAAMESAQLLIVLCVFAVMIALWCLLGLKLSRLPFLRRLLAEYKYVLVPVVYTALGVYIILKNIR